MQPTPDELAALERLRSKRYDHGRDCSLVGIAPDHLVDLEAAADLALRLIVPDGTLGERDAALEGAATIVEMSDLFWHQGDPRTRIAAAIRKLKGLRT